MLHSSECKLDLEPVFAYFSFASGPRIRGSFYGVGHTLTRPLYKNRNLFGFTVLWSSSIVHCPLPLPLLFSSGIAIWWLLNLEWKRMEQTIPFRSFPNSLF